MTLPATPCYCHCTDWRGFRRIMATGEIRPNRGELRSRHPASATSCCYRIGAVSLFDGVKSSFFSTWRKIHAPLTVVFQLDVVALAPNIVYRDEAQATAPGLMLRGEVCHRGPIPTTAIIGCSFVRARQPHQTMFLRADELTPTRIADAIRQLRSPRTATRAFGRHGRQVRVTVSLDGNRRRKESQQH